MLSDDLKLMIFIAVAPKCIFEIEIQAEFDDVTM